MTKTQALFKFFNSFDINAYPNTAVPDDVIFPYMTYEVKTGAFDSGPVAIGLSIWYHTDSESIPNAKVEEISKAIGLGGKSVRCDDGIIWIKKGDPFCINQNTQNDNSTKLRFINLMLEFITL